MEFFKNRAFTILLILANNILSSSSQIAWTNIQTSYVEGQLDMWTKSASGCSCSDSDTKHECACCVNGSGGCPCQSGPTNRCGQCGLHNYCDNMCNITISSSMVKNNSLRAFGEIKSPSSASGPIFCWYRFLGEPDERIELQIYRIKRLGRQDLKARTCLGGSLSFSSGSLDRRSPLDISICGENERYSPPIVLFKDFKKGSAGTANLLFHVEEPSSSRSQFIAHYAFVSNRNGPKDTSLHLKGGIPLPGVNSLKNFVVGEKDEGVLEPHVSELGCDWVFEETSCPPGTCSFASPGYPGIYDPNKACKYLISLKKGSFSKIRITFTSFSLPPNLCVEHFVSIYDGRSIRDPILHTLCGYLNAGESYEFHGPDILVEFSSSNVLPPYTFNGFSANIEFLNQEEEVEKEEDSNLAEDEENHYDPEKRVEENIYRLEKKRKNIGDDSVSEPNGGDCRLEYVKEREGSFSGSISSTQDFHNLKGKKCRVVLKGLQGDVLKVLLKSLHLHGQKECGSFLRFSVQPSASSSSQRSIQLHKFCSPYDLSDIRVGRVPYVPLLINSSTVYLDFKYSGRAREDSFETFFDFHNVLTEGHPVPNSTCDSIISSYGSSFTRGPMKAHGNSKLLQELKGPVRCSTGLVPQENESVVIKVKSVSRVSEAMTAECTSICNENGCRCSSRKPLSEVNHVLIAPFNGGEIACLCGNFTDLLPLKVISSTSIVVTYNAVSNENQQDNMFVYTSTYNFNSNNYEILCAPRSLDSPGVISTNGGNKRRKDTNLLIYYHSFCQWYLDMDSTLHHLNIQTKTKHFDCSTWNISVIPERSKMSEDDLIFCPEDVSKDFHLSSSKAKLVLSSLSPYPLDYTISWTPEFPLAPRTQEDVTPEDVEQILDEESSSVVSKSAAASAEAASSTSNHLTCAVNSHYPQLLFLLPLLRRYLSIFNSS